MAVSTTGAPANRETVQDDAQRPEGAEHAVHRGDPVPPFEPHGSDGAAGSHRLVPTWVATAALCAIVAVAVAAGFVIRGAIASTRDATLRQLDAVEYARARALRSPKDARAHLDLARAYTAAGKPASALAEYSEVLKANPYDMAALSGRGSTLLAIGQKQPALDAFWKVLGRDRGNVGAATVLGKQYAAAGQYRLIVSAVRPAAQLHPNEAELQCLMGLAYEHLGHTDWATVRYRLALRADPGIPDALAGLKRVTANQ